MKNLLLIISLFLFCGVAYNQRISIEARLDTPSILIGEQIHLTFELIAGNEVNAQFPVIADTLRGLEILDTTTVDTQTTANGDRMYVKRYTITSFDSGMHRIPGYPFIVRWPGGTDTLMSREQYLNVYLMDVDTATVIKDIIKPLEAPVTFREILPFILLGLLVLAAAAGVYYLIRVKQKKLPLFGPPKPREPAHTIALRELDALSDEKLWQKNEFKNYYSRLTDILRTYFDNRYGMRTMEMTTDEILAEFSRLYLLDSSTYNQLTALLQTADKVKFARYIPLPDECDRSLQTCYQIVISTKLDEVLDETAIKGQSVNIKSEEVVQ